MQRVQKRQEKGRKEDEHSEDEEISDTMTAAGSVTDEGDDEALSSDGNNEDVMKCTFKAIHISIVFLAEKHIHQFKIPDKHSQNLY